MNNQNNFGNHSGYMSGYQQYHQQPQQQQFGAQLNYPQYIADQYQPPVAHHLAYPPPNNFQYSHAPPPPPEEKPPEPFTYNSGSGQSSRGNFHNVNQRGQNKPNWPRGNHRGGNRGLQNFSGFKPVVNNFSNNRDMQQNQGGQGPNRNKGRNQNFNQSSQQRQYNEPPQTDTTGFPSTSTAPATQKNDPPPVAVPLTQEEIEFNDQFKKWEDEFDKWKQANVNHPDREAYTRYEQQFEGVRVQLLQRRNEMQKKKKEQQMLVNPPKTAEQEKFESQWKAGDPQNEQKKPDSPQPSTSKPLMPPQTSDPKEFTDDFYEEIENFESLEAVGESFNSVRIWPSRNDGIPCLDLAPPEPAPRHVSDVPIIDLDPEENFNEPKDPPALANFKPLDRQVINIEELLEHPRRLSRPEKIIIFIRGAPGSGKTYLANLILEKEKQMGNNRTKILRVENIDSRTDQTKLEELQENLFHQLRDELRQGFYQFIVVELEGGRLVYLNKYSTAAKNIRNFSCYVIEIHQTLDVCLRYNRNRRSRNDIQQAIADLEKFKIPQKMILLDPSYLLFNVRRPPSPAENLPSVEPKPPSSALPPMNKDLTSNLAQLLQNKNVMSLLQSQLNIQSQASIESKSATKVDKPTEAIPSLQNRNMNQQQSQFNQQRTPNFVQPNMQSQSSGFGDMSGPMPFSQGLRLREPQMQSNMRKDDFGYNLYPQQPHEMQMNMRNDDFGGYNNFSQQNSAMQNNMRREEFGGYNNFPQQSPATEPTYNEVPTFTPVKIVDYKHVHLPTLAEQLLEFRVFRVIDYKHRSTPQLREFVKDIDVDKIIEKRKAVALRKKILEYLKSAERPEDTVSNPKYPRNWEVIERERPPTKNKRKKKLTAKIRRVIAQKTSEWMTFGYTRDRKMDLEEISSEDDSVDYFVDEPPRASLVSIAFKDPFESLPRTVPSFNGSNHPNVEDVKTLLWKPDRSSRPPWIMIILRGAPGSGKSHLTQLIKRKELEMVNSGPRIISINDYFEDDDGKYTETDPKTMETYLNQMVKFVEKTIKERRYEMIIVDAENVDLTFYNKFHQAGTSKGFTTFTIEMNQTFEYCKAQNIHNRPDSDIKAAIEKLEKNPTPYEHRLLIPTVLYIEYSCLVNPALVDEPIDKPESSNSKNSLNDSNLAERWEKFSESLEVLLTETEVRPLVNIKTILDEPWRSSRDEKILIILRGAPGCGKSHLACSIRNKEAAMNSNGVWLLSIADYFIDPLTMTFKYDESKLQVNNEKMLETLKNIIAEGHHNFIIIDAKNENQSDYQQFIETGKSSGFKCYLIDFYSAESIFKEIDFKTQTHDQSKAKLLAVMASIPEDVTLLSPLAIYNKDSERAAAVLPLKSALRICENPLFPAGANLREKVENKPMATKKDPPKIPEFNWHNREIIDARDILEDPGRSFRPEKIVVVLRGAPGSGKSFLADLIQQKETKQGNRAQFKIISLEAFVDDNFQSTKVNEYMENLIESLNEIMQSSKFKFIVVDADCCDLSFYHRIYEIAQHHNFTGYTIELNQDDSKCIQQCDHKRDEDIIARNKLMASNPTPSEHFLLDPEYLYEENCFEDNDESMEFEEIESDDEVVTSTFGPLRKPTIESKWDDDGDAPDVLIERLDGTRNKTFEHLTMAAYLQTDDEWTMRPSTSGKKRVRWADIEEKKEQERMREIGFIVGQTDWKRMTDTTDGKSALEKTKYIEPRKK